MASAAELIIKLSGKDAASSVLDNVSAKAKGLGSAFGTALKVGAVAAAAGIGAATFAAVDFLKAAAEEQAGIERLGAAVTAAGEDWAAQKDSIEAVVSAREKLAFSDDALRSSLSLLTALTGSSEEAIKRQAVAMDLARGAGIDLETASRLLGKVTDENVNVLARYGIKAKEGMDATELLGLVQEKFGGQSAAFANTAAGKWAILTNQIGNVKEALGAALLPVATKVFGAIGTFLTEHLDDIERFSQRVVDLGERGFKAAMPYVLDFANLISTKVIPFIRRDLIPAIQTAIPWFQDLARTALEVGKGIAQFLAPALDTLSDLWANLWPVLEEHVLPVLKQVGEFLTEHKELIIAAVGVILLLTNPWLAVAAAIVVVLAKWDEISKFFTVDVPGAIDSFLDKIGEIPIIGEIFKTMWADIEVVTKAFWDGIKIYVETAINVVKDVIKIVTALIHGDWEEAWDGIKQLFIDVWDGITGLVGVYFDAIWGIFQNRLGLLSGLWTDTWNGLTAGASLLATKVETFGKTALAFFFGLPSKFLTLGGDIIHAFWNGLEALKDWLIGKVTGFFGDIAGAAKDALGDLIPGSPSKLGLDVGKGFGLGVVQGLQGMRAAVAREMGAFQRLALSPVFSTVPSAQGGGAVLSPSLVRVHALASMDPGRGGGSTATVVHNHYHIGERGVNVFDRMTKERLVRLLQEDFVLRRELR